MAVLSQIYLNSIEFQKLKPLLLVESREGFFDVLNALIGIGG